MTDKQKSGLSLVFPKKNGDMGGADVAIKIRKNDINISAEVADRIFDLICEDQSDKENSDGKKLADTPFKYGEIYALGGGLVFRLLYDEISPDRSTLQFDADPRHPDPGKALLQIPDWLRRTDKVDKKLIASLRKELSKNNPPEVAM